MIKVRILAQKRYNGPNIIRGIELEGHAQESDSVTNSHLCEEVSSITSALYVIDNNHTSHINKGEFRYEWTLEESKKSINNCMCYVELLISYLKVLSEKYRGMISFERDKISY